MSWTCYCYGFGECWGWKNIFIFHFHEIKVEKLTNHPSWSCCENVCTKFLCTPKLPILHYYHWVEWRKILLWVGAISCLCEIGLFGSNFVILSILFVDRNLNTYVFCFVGPPSIDMAKSIYGLGSIPLEGREGGGVL
jgi:hypothetical protein